MLTVALFLATLVALFSGESDERERSDRHIRRRRRPVDPINRKQNRRSGLGPFTEWIERYHAQIVILWLTGFLFLLSRMGGSLWFLRRLRRAADRLEKRTLI